MEVGNLPSPFFDKPRYYDAPDGKRGVDKLVASCKKGFVAGLFLGLNDSIWFTEAKNAVEVANCMGYWIVPLVGMSATFTAVTYMATNIRGKDDRYNYAIGALSCSPILHAWKKSTPYTLWGTAIFVAMAMAAKHKVEFGWEIFPTPKTRHELYQLDWSVVQPRDKNFRSPYF